MTYVKPLALLCAASAILISSTTMAATYLGKVVNLSKTKPLILRSISITSGELQPPSQIPPQKGGFFNITDKQNFLTFVYGYDEDAKDPVKAKGAAATCVIILTGAGKYRINTTNPDKVACELSEDLGGVTISINNKTPENADTATKPAEKKS